MEPIVNIEDADEIVSKILSKQPVSEEEFRYSVLFNLTAMTQLLWELTNKTSSSKNVGPVEVESDLEPARTRIKSKALRLVPVAALVAFLAGVGLGYVLP